MAELEPDVMVAPPEPVAVELLDMVLLAMSGSVMLVWYIEQSAFTARGQSAPVQML